jgi:hypothetical protein
MKGVFRLRLIGSTATAWLMLVAVGTFAPGEALAGCGHPDTRGAGGVTSHYIVDSLVEVLSPSASTPGLPESGQRPGPCAGGACSPRRESPARTSGQVLPEKDQWGALSVEPPDVLVSSRVFASDDARRLPFHVPNLIDRPPWVSGGR